MFRKTKRRIVFTVVFSLIALMIVTLTTIYVSNHIALDRENSKMLRMYTERFSLEDQPFPTDGEQMPKGAPEPKPVDKNGPFEEQNDGPGRKEPEFRLSTFYSVVYGESGDVLSVNNGNNELQSEESLLEIASSILKEGKKSGKSGNMAYLVEKRDGYTLVAMIDSTINDNNQNRLFRQMLTIGSAATVILILLSVFIARRIVSPLEENDRRQKRFVSDAGHELKTPLAVISANSELLRRETGQNEWLDNIDYETTRMSDLVRQLLNLSRAERGDTPRETVDFTRLVQGEVLPFESLFFEKGKQLESALEPDLFLDGDPNQLRQLLSILLDNALSHGTGSRVELSLKRERTCAALTVSNDAEEMSGETLSRLFDRFYRVDEARSGSVAHYGLGLSIAQAIAEAHGGSIRADYKDGKAVFTVVLPLRK